jgi:MarR family transcriptional regulator for hemolysin
MTVETPYPSYVSAVLQMRAYRALRSHVQGVLDGYTINATQWSILGHLYDSPSGVRPSDLAVLLDVKAPLITALVGPLETRGIVVRSAVSNDKRAVTLILTTSGQRAVVDIEAHLVTLGQRLFASVTPAEMQTYHKVLQTIIDA